MTERFEEGDELFRRRPDEFTAARNALVKRLRSEGRSDLAARVSGLRRPPLTAWALNQLARLHPETIEGVIGAGDRLREAMEQAIRGDRSGFQQAQADERTAIQTAVGVAAGLLAEGGGKDTEAARQRLTETLRAATVEPEVADQVRRGVLEADLSAPGFGLEGLSTATTVDSFVALPSEEDEATVRKRERDARIAELERELAAATSRLNTTNAEVEEAAARAAELHQQAAEAQREVKLAQKRLDQERAKPD